MRTLILLLLLLFAPLLPALEPPPHGVVLMYHRFGEDDYPTTNVRLEQFKAQLDFLQHEGFTVWPLRQLLHAVFNKKPIPDKTVSLTVDDAYLSVYQHAYPLLRQHGYPMTVFVSTEAIDKRFPGYMSWEQMREMQENGVDFANHGESHSHLHERLENETETAWRERVKEEIERAQKRLDHELGDQGMRLLAYPFGEFSCALAKLIREMGYIGFGQQSGALGPLSRLEALPRFPINEHFGDLDAFAIKAGSLPLPVAGQSPMEPQLRDENPPALTLEFAPGHEALVSLTRCYLGNGSELEVISPMPGRITVRAHSELRKGRSRYNCTAPGEDGRYYWFSQPWQNGPDAADPDR